MSIERHFLGWDEPAPVKVRRFLVNDTASGIVDLSQTLIVTPTRQSGRRLSESLVQYCATHGAALLGSRIVPPRHFLGNTSSPSEASPLLVLMTWAHLIKQIEPGGFTAAFPNRPDPASLDWALRHARTIQNLRVAVSEGGHTLADVADSPALPPEEVDRWKELAKLETLYLATLSRLGAEDPVAHSLAAAGSPQPPKDTDRIILACVPDPSPLAVLALERLAETLHIDILVHAPEALAPHFDAWGRPDRDYWTQCEIPLPDALNTICTTDTCAGQSRTVIERMNAFRDRFTPAETAVGVPDASVARYLLADLEDHGITAFDPSDRSYTQHPLFSLVEAFCRLVASNAYDDLARLCRHPDLLTAIETAIDGSNRGFAAKFLTELDAFQNAFIPIDHDALRGKLSTLGTPAPHYARLQQGLAWLDRHVEPAKTGAPHTVIRAFLSEVYKHRKLAADNPRDEIFETVATGINKALTWIAEGVDAGWLSDPWHAMPALLAVLRDQTYHPAREDSTIDLEGWLELPWSESPHMVICGMNEGSVPSSRLGDVYLPDSLRQRLGLRDDEALCARDSYLLSGLIAARETDGALTLIVGRLSSAGDPLRPSRLLFRCSDRELPKRAEHIFKAVKPHLINVHSTVSFPLDASPPPDVTAGKLPLSRLSVTAFRSYLACPFRFYLQRVLGMEAVDDDARSMDELAFGIMVHHALERMKEENVAAETDVDRLAAFLSDAAEQWAIQRYGRTPAIPIVLQIEAARQRLQHAARVQVQLTAEGWDIVEAEPKYTMKLNGVDVVGKIDRIDRNRNTGKYRILDYKTTDSGSSPDKTHIGSRAHANHDFAIVEVGGKERAWVDLQLPLYAGLARSVTGDAPVTLGYFNLPKAVTATGLSLWDALTPPLIDAGITCAGEIVAAVNSGCFWPPADKVTYDDFDMLFTGAADKCFVNAPAPAESET